MQKSWGPFSGRQLTVIVVAVCAAVVLLPGAVWAVDSFTNVAIQDPVSGAKASVDAGHHLVVGDGSGPLTVDGTVSALPSAANSPFNSEATAYNYNTYGYQLVTGPTSASVALTHLAVSNSGFNASTWATYLFQVKGSTASDCTSFTSGIWKRVGVRNVGVGQTLAEDFTTPVVLRPFSTGTSWCLVAGSQPQSNVSGNDDVVRVDYSGFVLSGTFTPPTQGPVDGPTPAPNRPTKPVANP